MGEKRKGTVKWFNDLKGFGFIENKLGEPDIFVHCREIQGEGFKRLLDGEEVLFELKEGPKGPLATNVVRLTESLG
jgi:cold shock protein